MSVKNALILIPTPVYEHKADNISQEIIDTIKNTHVYIVERLRTARRFIKSVDKNKDIDQCHFFELGENPDKTALFEFLKTHILHENIGVMSEAGCPAVADPGSLAVEWCHKNKISVRPLAGPSSIIMSLMASGFNGQNFTFHGYLPNKKPELVKSIKWMISQVQKIGQTQIFIETPYRNKFMIEALLSCMADNELLCVAVDIDGPDMSILTLDKKAWSKVDLDTYHKRPAVFLLGR